MENVLQVLNSLVGKQVKEIKIDYYEVTILFSDGYELNLEAGIEDDDWDLNKPVLKVDLTRTVQQVLAKAVL